MRSRQDDCTASCSSAACCRTYLSEGPLPPLGHPAGADRREALVRVDALRGAAAAARRASVLVVRRAVHPVCHAVLACACMPHLGPAGVIDIKQAATAGQVNAAERDLGHRRHRRVGFSGQRAGGAEPLGQSCWDGASQDTGRLPGRPSGRNLHIQLLLRRRPRGTPPRTWSRVPSCSTGW